MGDNSQIKVRIDNDRHQAQSLMDEIMSKVEALGYDDHACFAIRLSLDEGLSNAINHGNANDPSKHVDVAYVVNSKEMRVSIADEGQGFKPSEVPDPTEDVNLERPCGRGVVLMKAYMSEVEYNRRGNQVTLVKKKSCKQPAG